MEKLLKNRQKGITLIALIITIIILIILAGVAINLSFGENGLFSKAKYAKEKYTNEEYLEQEQLNEINAYLAKDGSLPENTKDTVAGTEVKMPDEWYTVTPAYVSTEDGNVVKKEVKVATVTAVATGDEETVPVPVGFYYVGGNKETGVIISDNRDDRYGYNPETKKENDTSLDKTTYEYTISLQGNQFVWIPCSKDEYKKCDTWNGTKQTNGTLADAEWDTTTPKSELIQIEKYGGFYVGRYEAGLASTITEFTTNQKHTGSNQIYNVEGIPQSKAGLVPWIFIDWTHAKANAENMYNNDTYKNYVSSGLITGTQWDVMLNVMLSKRAIRASSLTNSSDWGNYMDNSISYNGRLARADYNSTNSSAWTLKPFGTKTAGTTTKNSSNNGDLLTTGASATTEKYHIFDLAGNVWEWTEEDSHYATSGQYYMIRGGGFLGASGTQTACYRSGNVTVSRTGFTLGFRTVLYIK